ncbi:MAG: heme ABC transporter ATP-binding protein [Rhizomicrobium sp.]
MTAGLQASDVVVVAGGRRILDKVSAEVTPGIVTAVVGPNGAGKSTLLKVLSGDLVPQAGQVLLNGRPLDRWSPEDRALQRAVLPQAPELAFSFRAWDVVALGRHPHRGRATRDDDRSAVRGAMDATEVSAFAVRDCRTLSGGEMHRTHYARTLAQIWAPLPDGRARMLLLDEPTSSLDLFHQHAILAKARAIAQAGTGVLAVLHDLNLAAAYADRLIVLSRGRVEADGAPRDVLTEQRVSQVWRVDCTVVDDNAGAVQVLVKPHRRETA